MFRGRLTHTLLRTLDAAAALLPRHDIEAAHLSTGRRGEEAAYFYIRRLGYVMVARNFRVPSRSGEIDLIGWDGDTLCFIEVKTRTLEGERPMIATAESSVDRDKQRELKGMARAYLRRLGQEPAIRFDIVTVYYRRDFATPEITLYKGAF